jgi:O-antigen/teichoic acid export membrane protein
MFFIMGVTLYTSRVILQVLGVEDFGIYNLVSSIAVLFVFLNSAMAATTQRYINVEITSGQKERVNRVFCTSFNIHVIIALIVIFLAETLGLWFLNDELNIPRDRMYAANMVYQCAIGITALSIVRIPYDAIILAHEKMSFYAFLGIFENTAKLLAVFALLLFAGYDLLITYALLLLLVSLIVMVVYHFYCRRNFSRETEYHYYRDRKLFRELVSFSGWMVFGQLAVVGASQGLNIILNIFTGVVVNAAMGLANQVNTAVYSFISNFQIAFRPQLIQSYADAQYERHRNMVLNTSKYSFFLMAILAVPLLYFTEPLLSLWVGADAVPQYTAAFVRVVVLISLVDALAGPFWISVQANGNIKRYNVVLTTINLLVLPLAFVLLKAGFPPAAVLIGKFAISLVSQAFRYYFINHYLHFDRKKFSRYFWAVGSVFLFLAALAVLGSSGGHHDWFRLIINTMLLETLLLAFVYFAGLNTEEKNLVAEVLRKKLLKKDRKQNHEAHH